MASSTPPVANGSGTAESADGEVSVTGHSLVDLCHKCGGRGWRDRYDDNGVHLGEIGCLTCERTGRLPRGEADLSLLALAIYRRLSVGGWHPSEYEGNPEMTQKWYARISQVAARAARGDSADEWLSVEDAPDLPLHRTEANYGVCCATCDGGGCLDCTDPA